MAVVSAGTYEDNHVRITPTESGNATIIECATQAYSEFNYDGHKTVHLPMIIAPCNFIGL